MLRSIAFRLMSSYLVIIVITSVVFSYVGIRLIEDRVVAEAQHRVAESLNAAREIYSNELRAVQQSVRVTGERLFVRDAIASGPPGQRRGAAGGRAARERLDYLAVTDAARPRAVWRPSHPAHVGGRCCPATRWCRAVLARNQAVAATALAAGGGRCGGSARGWRTAPAAALVATPHARRAARTRVETSGMMLVAAAPVQDAAGRLIGVAYGGVLLNRRFGLVDRVKQVVFEDATYRGQAGRHRDAVPRRRADRDQRAEPRTARAPSARAPRPTSTTRWCGRGGGGSTGPSS